MKRVMFSLVGVVMALSASASSDVERLARQLLAEDPNRVYPLAKGYVETRHFKAPSNIATYAKPGKPAVVAWPEGRFEEDEDRHHERWEKFPSASDFAKMCENWRDMPSEHEYQTHVLDYPSSWVPIGNGIRHGNDKRYHRSGRLNDRVLAFDHMTGQTATFVAADSGGLWKSVIVALFAFMVPIGDNLPGSPSVGAFVVHPNDSRKIIVGTGNQSRYMGTGVYRTIDQGATWEKLTLPSGITPSACYEAVRDISDATGNTVLLATDAGVFRTTNFGNSWTRPMVSRTTDLVQDTTFPTYWYAGLQASGFYRSTNNGVSWTAKNTGITGTMGRVSIDYAKSSPNFVYCLIEGVSGGFNGIYRSSDYGDNWTKIQNTDTISWGQAFHTTTIAVSPFNPNRVLAGMGGLTKCENATAAVPIWKDVDGGHADFTNIQFSTTDPELAYLCNDGGLYTFDTGTNTPDGTLNTIGLANLQSYTIEGSKLDETKLMTGLQDNGQIIIDSDASTPLRSTLWAGDGGPGSFSSVNPDHIAYSAGAAYQRLVTTDGGVNWNFITAPLPTDWAPSMLFDPVPATAKYLYTGSGQFVYYRDVTAASPTWIKLHPTGLPNYDNGDPYSVRWVDAVPGGTFGWYAQAWGDYRVFYLTGIPGVATWANRTPPLPTGSTKNDGIVFADRYLSDYVYYTTGAATPTRAFLSSTRGASWSNVTGNLATIIPNTPFRHLLVDPDNPNILFMTTLTGVVRSDDGGTTWYKFMQGLPQVVDCNQMVLTRRTDGTKWLRLSTYGRGYWERKIEYYTTRVLTLPITLEDTVKTNTPITIILQPINNDGNRLTFNTTLPFANSALQFNVPGTEYQVWVKSRNHLARLVGVNLSTGNNFVNVRLKNGDVNRDNTVGTDDYLRINTAFDKQLGDAGFDAEADLTGDNYVGTDDYLILNTNFDLEGAEQP